jgi:hypothetical protein
VPVVKRYMEGDALKWEYPGIGTISMERICELPE